VVSYPTGSYGGVVRYDFGAWTDKGLQIRGHINSPPPYLLAAVNILRTKHSNSGTKIPVFLKTIRSNICNDRQNFEDQGAAQDRLFQDDCSHPEQRRNDNCEDCCDLSRSQMRNQRGVEAAREIDVPKIHYGNIGSSNQLQISACTRNQHHKQLGVICFEMEGAGVMQAHPCLVIRGICDYSDSHKNKKWQSYAAATAAAYAKEFLEVLPASNFAPSPSANQIKESGKLLILP
jgi:Phosphorylase superfamily